jgi:predicted DNA-binding transcriptional regulator YafY
MNRMDRLFAIVLQLQMHGQRRAQDLAAHFEVSVRTIYRDVQALAEAGVPVAATPGHGYALVEGYFLPPLMFTAMEAGALALGADAVAPTLDAPFRAAAESAQAKLAHALTADAHSELRQIQDSIRFMPVQRGPDHPRLRQIREAIVHRRALRIDYQAYGRPASERRDVEPYGLIHYAGAWHLLAYCRSREAPRNFRLDRINRVAPLPGHFTPRAGLRAGWRPPDDAGSFQRALVLADAAIMRWLREDPPYGLVEEQPRGAQTLLVLRTRRLDALAGSLLRWGGAIEVLEPPALRELMAEQGRRIAARHGTGSLPLAPIADAGDAPDCEPAAAPGQDQQISAAQERGISQTVPLPARD